MEIIDYTPPTSWHDKGMNWNKPDPANIDYMMAIRGAIIEKAMACGATIPVTLFKLSPYSPLSVDLLASIRSMIYTLAANFVDITFKDYQADGSDFPKMHDYGTLILPENCRICNLPSRGSLIADYAPFLIAAKNVLDKLTVVKHTNVSGTISNRDGGSHDPPSVSESIEESIKTAMENEASKSSVASFPQSIWNKSGTTHYNQTPGYCGYVYSRALKITMASPPVPSMICKIIIATIATKVSGNVGYSHETEFNDYDRGPSNIPEGVTLSDYGVWREQMTLEFGSNNYFPRYPKTPTSQWEPSSIRRGSWLGNEIKIHSLLDYGISGGFKFQK